MSGDSAAAKVTAQDKQPGGAAGAYAPVGTAAPAPASVKGPLGKDGKTLTLRFVLPAGPGSQSLRGVGDRIAAMLEKIGIGTEITKVPDESYFKDHIASGDYDLALYSWPATAYPATDGRPIYAKPEPPPTVRSSSSRTTPGSAPTTSTSSSTRRSPSSTRRLPGS